MLYRSFYEHENIRSAPFVSWPGTKYQRYAKTPSFIRWSIDVTVSQRSVSLGLFPSQRLWSLRQSKLEVKPLAGISSGGGGRRASQACRGAGRPRCQRLIEANKHKQGPWASSREVCPAADRCGRSNDRVLFGTLWQRLSQGLGARNLGWEVPSFDSW